MKLLAPEKAVQIRMKDGIIYTTSGTTCPLGDPENPMTMEQFGEKLYECAENAPKKMDRSRLDELIRICGELENIPNVSIIPALIA